MRKMRIVLLGIILLLAACSSLTAQIEMNESAEPGDTISSPVSALRPNPSSVSTSVPGLFNNADVTLNGCNNEYVAVADGTLYLSCMNTQDATDFQAEPYTWHLLNTYDLSTGLPGQPLIHEIPDEFGCVGYSFICAYRGKAYFAVETDIGFNVERIGMDGSRTVVYQVPEKPTEDHDCIYDDYWQAGKYLFYNYFPPSPSDSSVLIRIDMNTDEYVIIENSVLSPDVAKSCDGQFIYYFAQNNDGYDLCRMDLDCNNGVCLVPDVYSNYLLVSGERVYYLQNGTTICSVDTDGKDKREIADITGHDVGEARFFINIANDYIYYTNPSDTWKLYRMKTDGTEKQKIGTMHTKIVSIDIAAGRLFVFYWLLSDADYSDHIVTMLLDGSDVVELY